MADFDPPFAHDADLYRSPTTDERNLGIPCDPFDRALWNYLIHAPQAEIGNVILYGGLAGSDADMTQLRQAISNMIAAAVGAPDPSIFVTMAQARARLPIYPEVSGVTGHYGMTSPVAGTVRIPAGVTVLHRGIFPWTSAQTDFATDPSKTYHVRCNLATGVFTLNDLLGGGAYNPGSLAETTASFDSTYDDMLLARIVTNAGNVATITNLANRNRLQSQYLDSGLVTSLSGQNGAARSSTFTYNWGRTPVVAVARTEMEIDNTLPGSSYDADETCVIVTRNRYLSQFNYNRDFATALGVQAVATA